MQRIKIDLSRYAKDSAGKIYYEYQLIGMDIEKFFGLDKPKEDEREEVERKRAKKGLWSSFWRIEYWKHRQALKVCEQKGIKNIKYFWGVMKNI